MNMYKDADDGCQQFFLELEFVSLIQSIFTANTILVTDDILTFWNLRNWHTDSSSIFERTIGTNRLKHVMPRTLPEPVATPQATVHPPALVTLVVSASSSPVPTSAARAKPSHVQYAILSRSSLAKNDPRNDGVDPRNRK
ncbi:hypothetical protein POM88_009564 [Heracleum sosnowskyi]|uniref:Uncharacterized protein n=1 Tax=Heracleum sosnowskyi TaxID=360622 RepID=A0AAD8JBQ3_9APIA|nr:hypothetical protein POM88_009564 [Heracleum sosnowskyi]